MERLDGKVHGTVIKNKDGKEIPPDEFVVFRPADNAFLPTLKFYREECVRQGAEPPQLRAVDELIARTEKWREDHPDRCKTPDVEAGEIRTS